MDEESGSGPHTFTTAEGLAKSRRPESPPGGENGNPGRPKLDYRFHYCAYVKNSAFEFDPCDKAHAFACTYSKFFS